MKIENSRTVLWSNAAIPNPICVSKFRTLLVDILGSLPSITSFCFCFSGSPSTDWYSRQMGHWTVLKRFCIPLPVVSTVNKWNSLLEYCQKIFVFTTSQYFRIPNFSRRKRLSCASYFFKNPEQDTKLYTHHIHPKTSNKSGTVTETVALKMMFIDYRFIDIITEEQQQKQPGKNNPKEKHLNFLLSFLN